MARSLLPILIVLGGVWLVVWIFNSLASGARSASERANQQKLEHNQRKEEAIRITQQSAPELAELRNAVTLLRDFVARANAYRPKFVRPSELKFRQVRFSFPFGVFFPRDCVGSSDGPDPEPWITTIDSLVLPKAQELRSIYEKCMDTNTFPCSEPILSFDPPPPPKHPELPASDITVATDDATTTFLIRVQKLFTFELSQAWKLQEAANRLTNELAQLRRKAEEAKDLMDIHIANERLAYREMQNSLTAEFNHWKRTYEQEADNQLAPLRSVLQDYTAQTSSGIEGHFQLALRTLHLPLPANFPWSTFYDPNERLLQINQRVPSISDIIVKRLESKRPPAKRDTDHFLRRIVLTCSP